MHRPIGSFDKPGLSFSDASHLLGTKQVSMEDAKTRVEKEAKGFEDSCTGETKKKSENALGNALASNLNN